MIVDHSKVRIYPEEAVVIEDFYTENSNFVLPSVAVTSEAELEVLSW